MAKESQDRGGSKEGRAYWTLIGIICIYITSAQSPMRSPGWPSLSRANQIFVQTPLNLATIGPFLLVGYVTPIYRAVVAAMTYLDGCK